MYPTPKSLKTDKQKQTFNKMTTAVSGYQRIQQLNHFYPDNKVFQNVLKQNIGKNEYVTVTDFLLGNDYTKIESPYLAAGLLTEIRNHKIITKRTSDWIRTIKTKILKSRGALDEDNIFSTMIDLFRFLMIYPPSNLPIIQIGLQKCMEFNCLMVSKVVDFQDKHGKNIDEYEEELKIDYYKMITRFRRLYVVIRECVPIFLDKLEDEAEKQYFEKNIVNVYLDVLPPEGSEQEIINSGEYCEGLVLEEEDPCLLGRMLEGNVWVRYLNRDI